LQVHDFNGTISPSGLFWQVPDSALTVTGRTVRVQVDNVAVVDNFTFLGPSEVPATASFDITWTSFGKVQHYRLNPPIRRTYELCRRVPPRDCDGIVFGIRERVCFHLIPWRNFSRNLRGDGNGTKRGVPDGMTWLPLGAMK